MKFETLFLMCLLAASIRPLSAAPLQQNARLKGGAAPVAELPAYLKPAPDSVSLIADFDHKVAGEITVYLINTTEANVTLASQDGDLGCKREAKSEIGKWMRSDSHGYSWCGNSYGIRPLKAGQFLAWTQICDTPTGKARAMRFKLYGQGPLDIASNEGSGIVDESDVQFCRYDAMAMQHGPFEDVAAVATGKIKGGDGASINGLGDAIRGLGRFKGDARLLPVVKEVIARVVTGNAVKPDDSGLLYTDCLAALKDTSQSREELWSYVNGQLHDKSFPWRPNALEWLVSAFEWEKDRLRPVIEEVLATPEHPALGKAMSAYSKVVEKPVAALRLAEMAKSPSRPDKDRRLAQRAYEALFFNPFLSVHAEAGKAEDWERRLPSLKKVTITNISPQTITFPVGKPEALFGVELGKSVSGGEQIQRHFMSDEPGSLTLQAGQSVVINDVRWWEALREVPIDAAAHYSIHFTARAPGVWEVPAQSGWGWLSEGSQIIRTLDTKPVKNK